MNDAAGNRRRQAGFSLMELLVALVILALIMGVVGPRVIGYLSRAKSQTAETQVRNMQGALDMFMLDVGRYPTEEEGLRALVAAPASAPGWAGPYLDEDEVPADPWGRPYLYATAPDGVRVRVYSLGRDGVEGGSGEDADIGRPAR
ncbi:type II secretion system major pseudopilin GspG [Hyphomonas sp.]|uniref:type II secretion system major pseudopilin GspG n=1 Tax=Hyphomonas sp. TaxID=87 RepID=UPI0039190186